MIVFIFLLTLFCTIANASLSTNADAYQLQLNTSNYQPYVQKFNLDIQSTVAPRNNTFCSKSFDNNQEQDLLILSQMSPEQMNSCFSGVAPQELFSNYHLYSNNDYVGYIRKLPGYEQAIISLQEKIQNDKQFRKNTARMPGFKHSFFLWWENSEFHDFINREAENIHTAQDHQQKQVAEKIRKTQERQSEEGQCLEIMRKEFAVQAIIEHNPDINERLSARIQAIDQMHVQPGVCFDYSSQVYHFDANDPYAAVFSKTYGTPLDCQIHKELSQTRSMMMRLEHDFSGSHHVQIIAPAVHRLAAQAKQEPKPEKAFGLSDFCYVLTKIVCAAKNGVWQGTMTVLNPEHWQEMAQGTLHLALLFADAVSQNDRLCYASSSAIFSKDPKILLNAEEKFRLHTQDQIDALNQGIKQTYEKIVAMSWQTRIEKFAKHGTTIILDVLAFNALSGFASTAGRAAVTRLSTAMERGLVGTEQYAVEVAGFGKLIIEEGPEFADKATNFIKNDLALLSQEGKSAAKVFREFSGKAAQARGKEFEDLLVKTLGGRGCFKAGGREFDGAIGNI